MSCSKTVPSKSLVSSLQHATNPFEIHQTSILVSIYVPKLGSAPGFILVREMGWNLCRTCELGGATLLMLVCCKVNLSPKIKFSKFQLKSEFLIAIFKDLIRNIAL